MTSSRPSLDNALATSAPLTCQKVASNKHSADMIPPQTVPTTVQALPLFQELQKGLKKSLARRSCAGMHTAQCM